MTASSRGYAMDFGDIFQKKSRSSSISSALVSSSNNNLEEPEPRLVASRNLGTKEWQLPHYNTLEENAAYLNHQLEMQQFGIHNAITQLNFSTTMSEDDMRRIMDCIHWLLHSRRDEMHHSAELTEQLVRSEKEVQRKNNVIQSLTNQLESERKSYMEMENNMNAKEVVFAKERQFHKEEKRSLERKCAQLQHVDTNYKAQLRKSEVAYERLQKQYNAFLNKSSMDKRGMALGKELNTKMEINKVRGAVNSKTTGEHKIINTMIRSYETQQLKLLQENDTLRAHLAQFHTELKQAMQEYRAAAKWFLNRHNKGQLNVDLHLGDTNTLKNAFTMPLSSSSNNNNVLAMIQDQLTLLRSKIAALKHATQAMEREVLEAKLREAFEVIQEQDHIIRIALTLNGNEDDELRPPRLELSGLEDMLETLAVERREVATKNEHLEAERALFTQQAEELDKERLEFEFERQEALTQSHNLFVRPDAKKRLRLDTSNNDIMASPFQNTSGLHLPPTPSTARLLERIGVHNGRIMSPIAASNVQPHQFE
ncbi:unnamed protein product [Aphanomyces euteiches]